MNIIRLFPGEETPFAGSIVNSAVSLGTRDLSSSDEGIAAEVPRLRVLPAPARIYARQKLDYLRYRHGNRWETFAFILLAGSGLAGVVLSLITAFHR